MVSGGVLVAVVCGVVVRKQAPEIALVLTMCAAVAVLVAVSGELGLIVGYIQRLAEAGGISQELIAPVQLSQYILYSLARIRCQSYGLACYRHSAGQVPSTLQQLHWKIEGHIA